MSSLKNKFVYQLLLAATQVLLPLATYPYITRIFGPDNLGKVNYVEFLSQLFIILATFGIPFYGVREIAITRNDPAKRAALISELIVLQTIFAGISTCLFFLFNWQNVQQNPALYTLGAANIVVTAFVFEWYIQGMEHFRFAAIRTISIRILMLVALFTLIRTEKDYVIYFAIFAAGTSLIAIFNYLRLLKENRFGQQPIRLKKHLLPLWHFFLTSSAISIYIYFDTIILKYITHSDEEVGYYTTVLKMVKIFLVVIVALGTVLMPRISYLVSIGKKEEMKRHLNDLLQFIIVSGVPVCFGLLVLSPEIIRVIAGDRFLPAVPLMRTLAFLPLVIGLSNMFCFQTLVPFKQEQKFLLAVITGCVVSVALNFLLIPHFKAAGAAYACMATELLITIITGIQANRLIGFNSVARITFQTALSCFLFIPIIAVCKYFFPAAAMVLIIAVPACAILYFFVQYFVFKNVLIASIKQFVTNLVKQP